MTPATTLQVCCDCGGVMAGHEACPRCGGALVTVSAVEVPTVHAMMTRVEFAPVDAGKESETE
jgi:hypothetical protein